MLRNLLCLICVAVFAVSCLKKGDSGCPYPPNNVVAPQSEQDALATYLDTNGIVATKHPAGFYYTILNPGTGTDSVGLCSAVQVAYEGRLINGTVFDSSDGVVFPLGGTIEGWRKGIPLLKKGGKMKLYIPPSLAYGDMDRRDQNQVVVIPAKSILLFDVELQDFSPAN